MKRLKFIISVFIVFLFLNPFQSSAFASEADEKSKYQLKEEEVELLEKRYSSEEIKEIEQLNESIIKQAEEKGIITADEYIQEPGEISTYAGSYNGITARSGDILVARDNHGASKPEGWVGHAGIVVNGGSSVAEFPGQNMPPREVSLKYFFQNNSEIFVLRHNNYNSSIDAAQWANNYLEEHPNAEYSLTFDRYSLDPNYCSKFVWQAYYYGADETIAPFFPWQPLIPMEMVWFNQGTAEITYIP